MTASIPPALRVLRAFVPVLEARGGGDAGFGVTDEAGAPYRTGAPRIADRSSRRESRFTVPFREGPGHEPGVAPTREATLTLGIAPDGSAIVEETTTARAGDRAATATDR